MKKVVLFVFGIVTIVSCKQKQEVKINDETNKSVTKVETVKVTQTDKNRVKRYSGVIIPEINIPLSFLVTGKITHFYVDEGDFVKKGQILAKIDKSSYQESYNAVLAVMNQAQDAYDRLKPVYEKGTLPEIKWVDVTSKLEQAKASLNIVQKKLNDCTLKAPSDGIIGRKLLEAGTNITPANTVLNLVSVNKVYAKISVSENEINLFDNGQKASINIGALNNTNYQGTVEKIGIMANPVSRTYDVKILINNNKLKIKPGMICDVSIAFQSDSSVYVPYACVSPTNNGETFIYKVDTKNSSVKKVLVTTGNFLNNSIQIVSGVSVGDIIVFAGQQRLVDNQKVAL